MRGRVVIGLAAVCLSLPASRAQDASTAEPADAGELAAVVERLNAMDHWLTEAGARVTSEQRALDTAERSIAEHAERIRDLEQRVDQLRGAEQRSLAEGERLEARHKQLTARVADHLRLAWRLAGGDAIKQVLNHEDPATVQRLMRNHGRLARARGADLAALRDMQTALADQKNSLASERKALEDARAALAERRQGMVAERRKQRRLVAGLQAEVATKRRERERLEGDRGRLEALLAALARQAKIAAAERAADDAKLRAGGNLGPDGNLPWPVEGRVVHRFGEPRAGGHMRWQGVYLTAPLGTAIVAVAPGRVAFADWLRGFGMLAIIDHGDATMSLYGHADTLYKNVGDLVESGEPIASVGQSGGQSDVGVYFEIRRNGQPVDPKTWLRSQP